MDLAVVLVMHGVPPRGFPRDELAEFFSLHARLESFAGRERKGMERRFRQLERKLYAWPRTRENDPFFAASCDIAEQLGKTLGCDVFLGFNEFCAPGIDEAIDRAAAGKPEKIVIVTPMMTPGGEHSERDIPRVLEGARRRHPDIPIVYAWPYTPVEIADFLAEHIGIFLKSD